MSTLNGKQGRMRLTGIAVNSEISRSCLFRQAVPPLDGLNSSLIILHVPLRVVFSQPSVLKRLAVGGSAMAVLGLAGRDGVG